MAFDLACLRMPMLPDRKTSQCRQENKSCKHFFSQPFLDFRVFAQQVDCPHNPSSGSHMPCAEKCLDLVTDVHLIIGLLVGAGVTTIMFAAWQGTQGEKALIIPRILKQRTVLAAGIANIVMYAALIAYI